MTQYKVKSPYTGLWLAAPDKGMVEDIADAHCYPETDPHLVGVVKYVRSRGVKLVLRQVASNYVTCPECRGTCDSRTYPFYPCGRCEGRGAVSA